LDFLETGLSDFLKAMLFRIESLSDNSSTSLVGDAERNISLTVDVEFSDFTGDFDRLERVDREEFWVRAEWTVAREEAG
jgi:hypothetical protein